LTTPTPTRPPSPTRSPVIPSHLFAAVYPSFHSSSPTPASFSSLSFMDIHHFQRSLKFLIQKLTLQKKIDQKNFIGKIIKDKKKFLSTPVSFVGNKKLVEKIVFYKSKNDEKRVKIEISPYEKQDKIHINSKQISHSSLFRLSQKYSYSFLISSSTSPTPPYFEPYLSMFTSQKKKRNLPLSLPKPKSPSFTTLPPSPVNSPSLLHDRSLLMAPSLPSISPPPSR
jgi:hypothetical protein